MSGSLRTLPIDTSVGGVVGTNYFDGCPSHVGGTAMWSVGDPPASGIKAIAARRVVSRPLGSSESKGPSVFQHHLTTTAEYSYHHHPPHQISPLAASPWGERVRESNIGRGSTTVLVAAPEASCAAGN